VAALTSGIRASCQRWRSVVLVISALAPIAASAQLVPCDHADADTVRAALGAIERSVDPCGESRELVTMLETVRRCGAASYQICTSATANRNVFDRPAAFRLSDRRTITWNPGLRSELDPERPVDDGAPMLRDPAASLVHELAHAAQDCAGLNPGEHEFEAVRMENIYRRAAGLPQRRRYGDVPLPAAMVRECNSTACSCESADVTVQVRGGPRPERGLARGRIQSSGDSQQPPAPR
jgi:hypothetical protein